MVDVRRPGNGQTNLVWSYGREAGAWASAAVLTGLAVLSTESSQANPGATSTGISPWIWAVLAVQVIFAIWIFRSKVGDSDLPPLAWRVGFRFSGLVLILAASLVVVAYESPSQFGEDFTVLLAVVTAAGAVQFLGLGRLLSAWSRVPELRREVGQSVVQLSVYWTVVVMLLGAVLRWSIADELLTNALLAASVLSLPLVFSVLWSVNQSLSDHAHPPETRVTYSRTEAPSHDHPVRLHRCLRRLLGLTVFVVARSLVRHADR